MKKLAILVSVSLVIGIPLLHGCEKLNRIKTEEVSTTTENSQLSESNQSNCEEEVNRVEKELDEQERLESDIEYEFYSLLTGVGYEISKQTMIDFLVDYRGYDKETVNKVINNIDWDWKLNCLVSYKMLLEEGHREDAIVVMLEAVDFTDEEIQYAIDNH